jgi:hypothetical protein
MHVVAIHGWQEETAELAQALATALEVTAFDARQRLIGGGPAVVASFADPHQARTLAEKLQHCGFAGFVVDAAAVRSGGAHFAVRRFELGGGTLRVEAGDGRRAEIAYGEIDLLLSGTCIAGHTETRTVTDRKFSMGRTLLAGGVPLTKKVKHQEEVTTEEREEALYLCAGSRPPIVFHQNSMVYDGLGGAMKLSRELNFAYLTSELRRLSPAAVYDERLRKRAGQVRLLGPALNPETNLDLAVEILARSLRRAG